MPVEINYLWFTHYLTSISRRPEDVQFQINAVDEIVNMRTNNFNSDIDTFLQNLTKYIWQDEFFFFNSTHYNYYRLSDNW